MFEAYRFANVELDFQRFSLHADGRPVPVQPKVLRLLMHLVKHHARVVSTEELLAELWPGERVTVASVKRAVHGARRALKLAGVDSKAIRTWHNSGYRFTLPVAKLKRASDLTSDAAAALEGSCAVPSSSGRAGGTFIGRTELIAQLRVHLSEVCLGPGRIVLLEGEPGIGKSTLLRELSSFARDAGFAVWSGRSPRQVEGPGLWPVREIVQAAAEELGAEVLRKHLGGGAPDIACAIPVLQHWLPDLSPAQATPTRLQVFDSLVRFLRRAAEQHPLLLIFDDLEQADGPTREWFAFAARQLESSSRILLVGARRLPVEHDPLTDTLAAPIAHTSRVSGFDHDEIARFVELESGRTPSPDEVVTLRDQTGGNPLFLRHLLRNTLDAGSDNNWQQTGRGNVAWALKAVINQHLASRASDELDMLRAAAVLGSEFASDVLAEVCGLPSHAALTRLAAVEGSIIEQAPRDASRYRFMHALLQEALYHSSPGRLRADLHQKAALALCRRASANDDASLRTIGEHFLRAAPTHIHSEGVGYLTRAGERAFARLAYEEAAHCYKQAVELHGMTGQPAEECIPLIVAQAGCLAAVGRLDRARETWLAAGMLAQRMGCNTELVQVATILGQIPESGRIDQERVRLLEEALELVPVDGQEHLLLRALLAKALMFGGSAVAGRQAMDGGAIVDRLRCQPGVDPRTVGADRILRQRAEVLRACTWILEGPEHRSRRVWLGEEQTRIARALGDPHHLSIALHTQIWNDLEGGAFGNIEDKIEIIGELGERHRVPAASYFADVYRAMWAILTGHLDDALDFSQRAHAQGHAIGESSAAHIYMCQRVAGRMLHGEVSECRAEVRAMASEHLGINHWTALGGLLDATTGRVRAARRALEELLADDLEANPAQLSMLAVLADLCRLVGRPQHAGVLYEALVPHAGLHATTNGYMSQGPVERHLGALAWMQSEHRRARGHFERAYEAMRDGGPALFAIAAALDLADFLAQGGGRTQERAQALELASEARALAASRGLAARSARAGALLCVAPLQPSTKRSAGSTLAEQ